MRDTVDGTEKHSVYTQAGQIVFTNEQRYNLKHWYVYLGGSLVAIREQDKATTAVSVKYQHTDALGTPVVVTDGSRNVVGEYREYEPFGQVLNEPVEDGPGYTGHVMDAATGLAYMQQRYYDPGIGRFLSVDPVTAYDSDDMRFFNRYSYAFNNPYKFEDLDGRCPICPPPNPVVAARTQQIMPQAQAFAAERTVAALPKSGIVEGGGGGSAGTGQIGISGQGTLGALYSFTNGSVPIVPSAVYVAGGLAGEGTDGPVSAPEAAGGETDIRGTSGGWTLGAGLTNATSGSDLAGPAQLYQLNTPFFSATTTISESGIWTATIGNPDVGASVVSQPVYTEVIYDREVD